MDEEVKVQEVKDEVKQEEVKEKVKPKKKKIGFGIILLVLLVIVGGVMVYLNKDKLFKKSETKENKVESKVVASDFTINGNSLEPFDLYFLQLENKNQNMIYSPLSIKYALEMLSEGASGETKAQLDSIIGSYVANKYTNSANMSFGNAMFIRDSFKDKVSEDYVGLLQSKYGAEVIIDEFKTPNNINNWVKKNTFDLIPDLVSDVEDFDFFLVNALAIDMEWVQKITHEYEDYSVEFAHEDFGAYVGALSDGYSAIEFAGMKDKVKASRIGAVANKYDIVKDLGEDKIKNTIKDEYNKWLSEDWGCKEEYENETADSIANKFYDELKDNYGHLSASTDFYFYDNDEFKVFAKDLKEYNGMQLQYVGIMPKSGDLGTFIKNTSAKQVNGLIDNLKPLEMSSFEDGYVTYIHGNIPLFNYDYELDLMNDLKQLGITDVFQADKADLSRMVDAPGEFIDEAVHKANIDFSNDGIKAAAATAIGGKGSADCGFEYDFEVPVKEIDLSFDKPFMYVIRDVNSGEVWFTGAVYTPTIYVPEED